MSKNPSSHARRFVRSAWSLLTFQMIASAGAVAVTAVAAFHVQDLAAERDRLLAGDMPAAVAVEQTDPSATEPATEMPGRGEFTDGTQTPVIETPSAADTPAVATAPAAIATCARTENNIFHVPANAEWCDTGITLGQGTRIAFRAQGAWSHIGSRQYGPEGYGDYRHPGTLLASAPLASLIGRVGESAFPIGAGVQIASPARGTLQLSMNDVPGTFDDNSGAVDVFVYVSQ